MSLKDDLAQGETETAQIGKCSLCNLIAETEDPETKSYLTRSAAGSIGEVKLSKIFQSHDLSIGRRTIARHRAEEHQPS